MRKPRHQMVDERFSRSSHSTLPNTAKPALRILCRWRRRAALEGAKHGAPGGEQERGEVAAVPPRRLREHLRLDQPRARLQQCRVRPADAAAAAAAGEVSGGEQGAPAAGDERGERGGAGGMLGGGAGLAADRGGSSPPLCGICCNEELAGLSRNSKSRCHGSIHNVVCFEISARFLWGIDLRASCI